MGTAVRPAKTSPGPRDPFADVDAFVDEVLAELEAMAKDGKRPIRSGPKPPLAGAALRKAIMAIWCVCFCGMQWRAIGLLCDIPFGTLYGLFVRWTRLGLWRRLLSRLRRAGTVKLSGLLLGGGEVVRYRFRMTMLRDPLYAGYRFPAELIGYAVWLYFRFPLSLRMVEEMLAARGI
jgi:hypothetical protein